MRNLRKAADIIYDAKHTGDTLIGKAVAWLLNALLVDNLRQVGSPKFSGEYTRKFLSKSYNNEEVAVIEQTYKTTVLKVMEELGKIDNVRDDPGCGNFGDLIFNHDFFYDDEASQELEKRVRQAINNIESE